MDRKMIRIASMFALALLVLSSVAWAGRSVEIRTKSGTRWRGEIGEEVVVKFLQQRVEVTRSGKLLDVTDYTITIETEIAGAMKNKIIFRDDIVDMDEPSVEENVEPDDRSKRPRLATSSKSRKDGLRVDPDKPGVFVLPLHGTVGDTFRHDEMKMLAEHADEFGRGQIIVLEIKSGGGSMMEMEQIHETLTEVKQRHRLVAWIEEAISAACATAIHCDEIYFKTEGTAGSMTGFNGATGISLKGQERANWLRAASEWMASGNRYPHIGPVMIGQEFELSYDKDEETGKVTWYDDLSGEFILSREGQNLTFNSTNAVHCGWADGVADTEDELAALLHLKEWNEKSDFGRQIQEEWIETTERAKAEMPRIQRDLQSGDLGRQKRALEKLIGWWNRAPTLMVRQAPPKEDLERELAEVKRMIRLQRQAGR